MISFIAGALTSVFSAYASYIITHNKNVEDKIVDSMDKHNIEEILTYFDKENIKNEDIEALKLFHKEINKVSIQFKTLNCLSQYSPIRNRLLNLIKKQIHLFIEDVFIFQKEDSKYNENAVGSLELKAENIRYLLDDIINYNCRKSFYYKKKLDDFKGNDVDFKLEKFFTSL